VPPDPFIPPLPPPVIPPIVPPAPVPPTPETPEPATLLSALFGIVLCGGYARRQRRKPAV